jgi:hypothetical protein
MSEDGERFSRTVFASRYDGRRMDLRFLRYFVANSEGTVIVTAATLHRAPEG